MCTSPTSAGGSCRFSLAVEPVQVKRSRTGTDVPQGHAISQRETRAALRQYAAHALGFAAGGFVALLTFASLGAAIDKHHRSGSGALAGLAGLSLAVMGVGLGSLFNAARMWRRLRRESWRAWTCRFREVGGSGTPNGTPTLVLSGHSGDEQYVLSVVSTKWRWRKLDACNGSEAWFAGDPRAGGVVAPPGGTYLLWARRPWLARRREMLRRQVAKHSAPPPR